jgi:hypothetical protein
MLKRRRRRRNSKGSMVIFKMAKNLPQSLYIPLYNSLLTLGLGYMGSRVVEGREYQVQWLSSRWQKSPPKSPYSSL